MTRGHGREPRFPEVLVYGAATCEDTAITRSRLQALGLPFREIDVDADPRGLASVLALEGRRVTPTVVLGDGPVVLAEPSIETLEERLRTEGAEIDPPTATQIRGPLAERPIPFRMLPDVTGGASALEATRWRGATTLFFAHDATCLACHGYAKQLARQAAAMRDADAQPVAVVGDTPGPVRSWTQEMPAGAVLLADPEGGWKRAVQTALSVEQDAVLLLVLDRYAAPRAVSVAAEAGGLIGPAEATDWLRFLALECPECDNDVTWPD